MLLEGLIVGKATTCFMRLLAKGKNGLVTSESLPLFLSWSTFAWYSLFVIVHKFVTRTREALSLERAELLRVGS
jgi:hypothetical protein